MRNYLRWAFVEFKNVVTKYPAQSSSVMIGIYGYVDWDVQL